MSTYFFGTSLNGSALKDYKEGFGIPCRSYEYDYLFGLMGHSRTDDAAKVGFHSSWPTMVLDCFLESVLHDENQWYGDNSQDQRL